MSIACFSLPAMSRTYNDTVFIRIVAYAIPIAQMCMFGSCYSTVAVTVERYASRPLAR